MHYGDDKTFYWNAAVLLITKYSPSAWINIVMDLEYFPDISTKYQLRKCCTLLNRSLHGLILVLVNFHSLFNWLYIIFIKNFIYLFILVKNECPIQRKCHDKQLNDYNLSLFFLWISVSFEIYNQILTSQKCCH